MYIAHQHRKNSP